MSSDLHFATFANKQGCFETSRIISEAAFFIDPQRAYEFNETNLDGIDNFSIFIKNNKRGFGYWIWKPLVVKRVFEKMSFGDVLLYCDAGCSLNAEGAPRLREYVSMAQNSRSGIVSFQMPHLDKHWCKRSLVIHLSDIGAEKHAESGQLMATSFLIRKSSENVLLVDKWLEIASLFWTIDDSSSTVPNFDGFREHRHDQAVWSLLRKCSGSEIVNDETWGNFESEEMKMFPIWATRKRK
jgi:hypothetical protein